MRAFVLIAFLSAGILMGCVREPECDIVGAWDAAIQDARADADTALSEHDATPDETAGNDEGDNDADTVTGDEMIIPDDDSNDDFPCLWDSCSVHEDCKRGGCAATFCTAELGDLVPNNPNVCAVRCDPANNSAECPDGMTCNDQITLAAQFGKDIDGAKGICAPSTRQKIAFSP